MTTSSKKRLALVGLGTHGRHAVLPAIEQSTEWELCAIADANPEHLACVPQYPGYPSLEALLEKESPDALYIATLPGSHCALAITAFKAGIHVICEKPMGATAEETAAMLAAAREAGRELIVMFENRFKPPYQKIRDWIREGALGRVEAIHLQSLGKHPAEQPRRTNLVNAAGSLDCGIHMLDLARYWNDGARWETIHALGAWFDEDVQNAPHLAILARLDNGVMVTFEDSFSFGYRVNSLPFNFGRNSIAITGSHGVILDEPGVITLISDSRRESVPMEVTHHKDEIPNVIDAFARHLRGETDPLSAASLAHAVDGHEAQRIVDETLRQARDTRVRFEQAASREIS